MSFEGAYLGGTGTVFITGEPGANWALGFDTQPGNIAVGQGALWLGLSPDFQIPFGSVTGLNAPLSSTGNWSGSVAIPSDPSIDGARFFLQAVCTDSTSPWGWAFSRASSHEIVPQFSTRPTWGSMNQGRAWHGTANLPNGLVMVVGGGDGGYMSPSVTDSCEFYDSYTRQWRVAPPLLMPRKHHSTTTLPGGRVLVVGGLTSGGALTNTTEIYRSDLNTWSFGPNLPASSTAIACAGGTAGRMSHQATSNVNGTVIIVGGTTGFSLQSEAAALECAMAGASNEVAAFDMIAEQFTIRPPLAQARFGHQQVGGVANGLAVVGGIQGISQTPQGAVPNYATSVEGVTWFAAPVSNLGTCGERIGHVVSPGGAGSLLHITGGMQGPTLSTTNTIERFSFLTGTVIATGILPGAPSGRAFLKQWRYPYGRHYLGGGGSGSFTNLVPEDEAWEGSFSGVSLSQTSSLSAPRLGASIVWAYIGPMVVGGMNGQSAISVSDTADIWNVLF